MNITNQKVYSDGTVESRIQEYLQSHNGDSTGIIEAIPEGAVFHNFTKARENLLRWYPFEKSSSVLEIGAGMGAMTTYLASVCASVVALEPSAERAKIITLRCANQKNVKVVQSSIDEYCATEEKFDYVLLLGVLEYAGVYSNDQNPWLKMVTNARSMLKPNGKLLLAIENKFGLKYWCGAAEDHTGIPFDSINDYRKSGGITDRYAGSGGVRTFSKSELEEMLRTAGFSRNKFFYMLPDYKFPMLTLTDESIDADHLVCDVKYTYPQESVLVANELQLYPEVIQNGTLGFFANSYLIEACNETAEPCAIATVTMKRDYKSRYRLITIVHDDKVVRIAGSEDSGDHLRELVENTEALSHRGIPCVAQKPLGECNTYTQYIKSPRADHVFMSALREGNVSLALKMIDLLVGYIKRSGELVPKDGELVLKEGYPDLTLRNSFWINEDLLFFDQEWKAENVPFKYMLYRSVRYGMMNVPADMKTIILDYCGITETSMQRFSELEEQFLHSLMDEEACDWFDSGMFCDDLKLESVVKRQVNNKQAHIELLLQSERDLQREVHEYQEKENQLKVSLTEKEEECQQLRDQGKELQVSLTEKEEECQQLRNQGKELQVSLTEKEEECQQLRDQGKELQASLAEKEDAYSKLEYALSCREGECQQLRDKENQLKNALGNKETEYQQLQYELACREGECQQLRDKENRFLNELAAIKATRSWRLGQRVAKFARFFVPAGSKRAMLARMFVTMVKHPGIFFSCLTPKKLKKFFRLLRRGDMEQIQALVQMNVTGQPIPSALEVVVPEIAPVEVEAVQEKTAADYPVLTVPQWENPTVSIVIPVYNQFEYTYHCVESILKNSGDITYEILIGNDCSTDLTTQIDSILPGVKCITNEKNLRFVLNCKNAAKYAKGKYLLFLNNDTQVQENWLEPLVTLIESADDIGMVGSKLIYPDGLLQEAGGILWRDGSAWNYGNRQNPSLPEFNYVKEVDYISGAAIMLSRALWEEIGGFDEIFVPAYCDDSDLAFTVRKKGYRVLYQPKSVVVHFEGVSNGKDLKSGQKAYQVVNQKKFFEKWQAELAGHPKNGENVFQARDRSYGKKTVLIIDHYVPKFDQDAGSRTIFQYIKLFLSQGYNVKFIGDNFFQHEPYTSILEQMGVEVLYGSWYADHWQEWIKENAEHIDYVFLSRPHISIKYVDFLRANTKAKLVYYGHDLHFLRAQREYEMTGDPEQLENAKHFQELEFAVFKKVDMVYYLSDLEIEKIHQIDPTIPTRRNPINIFDAMDKPIYDPTARKDLLFVGGFAHNPNVDAAKFLVNEIMPIILMRHPEVKLHLVGSHPPKEIEQMAGANVIVEGFVSDERLAELYQQCRIGIVPLRFGAGVKGKVIEGMRYGLPVVTTDIGAEGIPDIETILMIGNTAEELAQWVNKLYDDDEELERLSQAGWQYVRENFSQEAAIRILGNDFDFTTQ